LAKGKKQGEAERFLKELGEVLKERLKEMSAKELIEYGFYTTEGIILFFALDEVMHIDDMNRHEFYRNTHLTEYFLSLTREGVIKLFEATVALGGTAIPGTPLFPLMPLKWMVNPIYGVTKIFRQKQVVVIEGEEPKWLTHWAPVPIPIRALIAIGIPSLQFISLQVIRDVLEVG